MVAIISLPRFFRFLDTSNDEESKLKCHHEMTCFFRTTIGCCGQSLERVIFPACTKGTIALPDMPDTFLKATVKIYHALAAGARVYVLKCLPLKELVELVCAGSGRYHESGTKKIHP